jgi:chemotaxis protein CheY-P-specific phosphatase CheC
LSAQYRPFTDRHVAQLARAFHRGAAESSTALAHWLNAPTAMTIDSVDQCPLEDATRVLGAGDAAVCMCLMEMKGTLTGHMLLAFDDASGLAVTDLLLARPPGTAVAWGDMETSCILETMNIAGSAYLNGIARDLSERSGQSIELIPTPPMFFRDFAESLLETAFLDQAVTGRDVAFARARFDLLGQPLRWTFLLIPDPSSLLRLTEILASVP